MLSLVKRKGGWLSINLLRRNKNFPMNSIYFIPASQIENTGDLLINKVAVQAIQKYGELIIVDNQTDRWFIDEVKLTNDRQLSEVNQMSLNRHILGRLIKSLFRKDRIYVVFPPGHTARQGKDMAKIVIQRNRRLTLFKTFGVRIVRLGFSIGPFDQANLDAEAARSRLCYFYGLRDKGSLDTAIRGKFKNPQLFPDLAWNYEPSIAIPPIQDDSYIVLSFRSNVYGKEYDEAYFKPYVDRLKMILTALVFRKFRIVISYQVKYDREASFILKRALENDFEVQLIDKKLLLDEAAQIYSKAKFVISNRLHVLLFALQCHTASFPLIDPIGNKKIYHIWEDNKMSDAILDINATPEENTAIIQKGVDDENSILKPFIRACKENRKITEELLERVFR
jgi:polysaccharide pyruvyl transferase WcaK-like protein